MIKQDYRVVDRLDDRSHVFEFRLQLVLGGVTALAPTTTVDRVDSEVALLKSSSLDIYSHENTAHYTCEVAAGSSSGSD